MDNFSAKAKLAAVNRETEMQDKHEKEREKWCLKRCLA
jgi:hypothetical protein